MRNPDIQQLGMFSYVSVEDRVPNDHPIRKLRVLVTASGRTRRRAGVALCRKRPAVDSTKTPIAGIDMSDDAEHAPAPNEMAAKTACTAYDS